MRGTAAMLLVAGLTLGGCAQMLGIECENECAISERRCIGNDVELCVFNPVSGCADWSTDHECANWGAICVDGQCVCPAGLVDCGICADLATDPNHCGGCDVRCTGPCVHGLCSS
jgi:hypothetical protein